MGNWNASTQKSVVDYDTYMKSLRLVKKQFSDNLLINIEVYRPNFPEFAEDLVLTAEFDFEEQEEDDQKLRHLKAKMAARKNLHCRHITELIHTSSETISGICVKKLVYRFAFEFSDENLETYTRNLSR